MDRRGVFDLMQWGVFGTCVFLLSGTLESRVILKKSPFQCVLSTQRLQRVNVAYKLAKAFTSEGIIKKRMIFYLEEFRYFYIREIVFAGSAWVTSLG